MALNLTPTILTGHTRSNVELLNKMDAGGVNCDTYLHRHFAQITSRPFHLLSFIIAIWRQQIRPIYDREHSWWWTIGLSTCASPELLTANHHFHYGSIIWWVKKKCGSGSFHQCPSAGHSTEKVHFASFPDASRNDPSLLLTVLKISISGPL